MHTTFKSLVATLALGTIATGEIIFKEDFERGNLNKWEYQACPGGVTIFTDVARTGRHSAKFTVSDDDTNANCDNVPTENPRGQLVSDGLFSDGDEYYIAFSVLFPDGFPKPKDWFQLMEIYGPPFGGSPTIGVDICSGNRICLNRDETHNYDSIWQSAPIVTDVWRDIVLHVKFSTKESTGFVEIWDDGSPQKLSNGKRRIYYATLHNGINWDGHTPNSVFINQYRSSDEKLGTVTLYHDSVKVGTTLKSVMPKAQQPEEQQDSCTE